MKKFLNNVIASKYFSFFNIKRDILYPSIFAI